MHQPRSSTLRRLLPRASCPVRGAPALRRCRVVAAVTGLLCAAVVVRSGGGGPVWLGLALILLLVPITLIDLEHRVIPNALTGIGAATGLALLALADPAAVAEHIAAGTAAGAFLLLAAVVHPAGMGMGDVKLAGMLGIFLGRGVAPALVAALLAGSVVGTVVMARKGIRAGRKTPIPFGPFLAFGAVIGLCAGRAAVDWYLGTMA